MEQVQFWRQIPHPLCCPLPGSFLGCKRCWIGPQETQEEDADPQLKLQPNSDSRKCETREILRIAFINTPCWDAPRKISPERGFPQTNWALNCCNITRGRKNFQSPAQDPDRISPWPARSIIQWDFSCPLQHQGKQSSLQCGVVLQSSFQAH